MRIMIEASFWRRVGAFAIDAAAFFTVWGIFSFIGFAVGTTPAHVQDLTYWPGLALYFITFWMLGATPGMRATGLALMHGGARPGPVRAAIRFVVLGGAVALAGATLLLAFAPYVVLCLFGVYPHDLFAGTKVIRVTSAPDFMAGGATASGTILAMVRGFLILMVAGVVLGIAFGGIGDASYTAWVTNDGPASLDLSYAFNNVNEQHGGALAHGGVTSFTTVGGPRESPPLRVRGFDGRGDLVFCRDYRYEDYRGTSRAQPLTIHAGDLSCR